MSKDLKSEVTWGNERSQFGGLNRTSCGARLIVQEADCTLLCCLCRSRLLWGRLLLCMWFMQNMRYWLYIYVWFVPNHEILTVLLCVVSSVLWYVVCAKPWNTDCIVICGLCQTMKYWLYCYMWFVPSHEILTVSLCVVSSVLLYVDCAKPWNTDCIVTCG